MVVFILFPLIQGGRAGADDGHITFDYVKKLGKLIHGSFANKLPYAGLLRAVRKDLIADDAGVKIEFEHHAVFHPILIHQVLLALFRIHVHGADFIHLEMFAVLADTLLLEEDRAGGLLFDDWLDDGDDDDCHQASKQASNDIEKALDDHLNRGHVIDRCCQHCCSPDLLGETLNAAAAHIGDVIMGWNRHLGTGVHEFQDFFIGQRSININGVDPLADDVVGSGVNLRDDGVTLDLFLLARLREDNADNLIIGNGVLAQAPENLVRGTERRDHQHAVLFLSAPAAFGEVFLPKEARVKGKQKMEDEGQEDQDAGVGVSGLGGEHVDDCEGEDKKAVFESRNGFGESVTAHDIVHGVVHDQHKRIDQNIENADGLIEGRRINPIMVADQPGQNKCKLQADFVKDEKIKMFRPALCVSFIHEFRSPFGE